MKNRSRQASVDDFELLVSHSEKGRSRSTLNVHVKWYVALFCLSLVGCAGCLWAMVYTSHSEAVANRLGLTRVANAMERLLELFALPALMLFAVLCAYSCQQLYRLYKKSNKPDIRRRR